MSAIEMPVGYRPGALGQPVRKEPCPLESARWNARFENQNGLEAKLNESEHWVAHSRYLELCVANTGNVLDQETKERKDRERKVLIDQSHEIAQKLEIAGVQGYTDDTYGLFQVGLCSGEVVRMPNFRPIVFLPAHAQVKRAGMLRKLTYWLGKHPYARFWTITNGQRCKVSELRDRFKSLHRMISNLNAEDFMKDAGVEIVFRSSEIGALTNCKENKETGKVETITNSHGVFEPFDEFRNSDGEFLYHPHAHCIVLLKKGKLPSAQWSRLLRRVWSYTGCQFDDSSALKNVREAVKYCAKPSDVCNHSPDELKSLYEAMFNLNLAQPLGAFKAFNKRLKDNKLDVRRINTEHGPVWREMPNWNAHRKQAVEDGEKAVDKIDEHDKPDEGYNKLVAMTAPRPNTLGVSEPFAVVRGLRGSGLGFVKTRSELLAARLVSLEPYRDGLEFAAAISLDTTTLTAGTGGQGEMTLNPESKHLPAKKPKPDKPEGPRNWKDDPEVVNKLDRALRDQPEVEVTQPEFDLVRGPYHEGI